MTTEILDRLAAANPQPVSAEMPASVWSAADLRTHIEARRDDMNDIDVKELVEAQPAQRQPQRRALTAAVAFIAVMIVGLAAALIYTTGTEDRGRDFVGPATEQQSSDEGAVDDATGSDGEPEDEPMATAAQIAAANGVLALFNDDLASYATTVVPLINGSEGYDRRIDLEAALGAELTVTGCEPATFEVNTVRCTMITTTELHRALGVTPPEDVLKLTFSGDEDLVSVWRPDSGLVEPHSNTWWSQIEPFRLWVQELHPEHHDTLFNARGSFSTTDDDWALLKQLIPEFIAAVEANG